MEEENFSTSLEDLPEDSIDNTEENEENEIEEEEIKNEEELLQRFEKIQSNHQFVLGYIKENFYYMVSLFLLIIFLRPEQMYGITNKIFPRLSFLLENGMTGNVITSFLVVVIYFSLRYIF